MNVFIYLFLFFLFIYLFVNLHIYPNRYHKEINMVSPLLDFAHSAKRKLLMAVPDFEEKKSHFQLHGIILSAFVLCAMLILIALCGSNERKYVVGNYG